jgi:hypothetical protein
MFSATNESSENELSGEEGRRKKKRSFGFGAHNFVDCISL